MVSVFLPTLGMSPALPALLSDLRSDSIVSDIVVGDNGIDSDTYDFVKHDCQSNNATFLDQRGVGFYTMWNQAIDRAAATSGKVAILNDDIRIPPRMISHLENALVAHDLTLVCPDYQSSNDLLDTDTTSFRIEYVTGTYRHGGITGSAFLIDAKRAPIIDERFRIWYGDDDLVWKISKAGGKIAILRGLPLDHVGSVTVNSTPWVPAAIREDVSLWESLNRGPA